MKGEVNDLKKLVMEILKNGSDSIDPSDFQKLYNPNTNSGLVPKTSAKSNEFDYEIHPAVRVSRPSEIEDSEIVEESLSIEEKEKELIKKALEKYNGRRKNAASDLGISERTLYRKIKEYDLN